MLGRVALSASEDTGRRRRGVRKLMVGIVGAAAAALHTQATAGPPLPDRVATQSIVERVAVFGRDDRQSVPAKYEPVAQSLGILFNNQTRTVCSAFCVGPGMIATAAHCLAGPHGEHLAAANAFVFARGYARSRELVHVEGATTRSSAQNVLTGDFQLRVRPPIDAAHDWALVRLAKPACAKRELTVQPLPIDKLMEKARAGEIFQIAYHRDYVQWKPAYSKPCGVERDFENADWSTIGPDFMDSDLMIMHTCDTGGASSGSPMLLDTAQGPVVVGINVGTYVQSKVIMQNGEMTHRHRSETVANTAVNAQAFAEKIALMRSAHILASGSPMRELQRHLQQQRLYRGRIDGAYGPILRAAIESYERAHTLPVTGLATQGLLLRLASERSQQTTTGSLPAQHK